VSNQGASRRIDQSGAGRAFCTGKQEWRIADRAGLPSMSCRILTRERRKSAGPGRLFGRLNNQKVTGSKAGELNRSCR
jgi:hypothetical protein